MGVKKTAPAKKGLVDNSEFHGTAKTNFKQLILCVTRNRGWMLYNALKRVSVDSRSVEIIFPLQLLEGK